MKENEKREQLRKLGLATISKFFNDKKIDSFSDAFCVLLKHRNELEGFLKDYFKENPDEILEKEAKDFDILLLGKAIMRTFSIEEAWEIHRRDRDKFLNKSTKNEHNL